MRIENHNTKWTGLWLLLVALLVTGAFVILELHQQAMAPIPPPTDQELREKMRPADAERTIQMRRDLGWTEGNHV
jgi:hypothetical protein